ncbi:MAG: GNAT family N-acetyltransferase [Chitinophagaceae bacterium]|nr:GNAT family N-acetyltransferase [Chitinophagaceae bacterium]MCW5925424.1 GNAT family N-acetyltransferase [Chitinophagaceae bacterium]
MDSIVHFREATEKDIPLIQNLISEIWPKAYSHILSDEQSGFMLDMMYSDTSLNKQISSGHRFILTFVNDSPTGFASYEIKDGGLCKLHKIYVLPQIQGAGVGRKLIGHIITRVKPLGMERLELNVNRYNTARLFYEKMGFFVAGEEDIDIGNGYFMNDYIMRKTIV